jgi:hypothetical protein
MWATILTGALALSSVSGLSALTPAPGESAGGLRTPVTGQDPPLEIEEVRLLVSHSLAEFKVLCICLKEDGIKSF